SDHGKDCLPLQAVSRIIHIKTAPVGTRAVDHHKSKTHQKDHQKNDGIIHGMGPPHNGPALFTASGRPASVSSPCRSARMHFFSSRHFSHSLLFFSLRLAKTVDDVLKYLSSDLIVFEHAPAR